MVFFCSGMSRLYCWRTSQECLGLRQSNDNVGATRFKTALCRRKWCIMHNVVLTMITSQNQVKLTKYLFLLCNYMRFLCSIYIFIYETCVLRGCASSCYLVQRQRLSSGWRNEATTTGNVWFAKFCCCFCECMHGRITPQEAAKISLLAQSEAVSLLYFAS